MNIHPLAAKAVLAAVFLSGVASADRLRQQKEHGRGLANDVEQDIKQCVAAIEKAERKNDMTNDGYKNVTAMLDIHRRQLIEVGEGVFKGEATQIPAAFGTLFVPANRELSDLTRGTLNGIFVPQIPGAPEGFELFPPGTTERFQWFSPTIPSEYTPVNQCLNPAYFDPFDSVQCPVPPNFNPDPNDPTSIGPFNLLAMAPPLFHETTDVANWGYKKWPAVPACFTTYAGIPPSEFASDSPLTSIFTKNIEDRGDRNELKRKYMSALTCDKIGKYEGKVEAALDQLITELTDDPTKPVISTWFPIVQDLFLDIHFGEANHPEYVRRFFANAFATTGELDEACNPASPKTDRLYSAYCEVIEVKRYIQERLDVVIAEEDETSIIYWWNKAGLDNTAVIQEVIHNVLAFSTWTQVVYVVIAAKVQGRLVIENLQVTPSPSENKLDLFEKYEMAATEAKKFDVVREAYRLLLATSIAFSRVEDATTDNEPYDSPDFVRETATHIHFLIQAINDDTFNPADVTTNAYAYNENFFADFVPEPNSAKCPFLGKNGAPGQILGSNDFVESGVDQQTMIPKGHEKLIPVYDKPKYCPFGMGNRRCAGELLNYMFMDRVLAKLGVLEYKVDETDPYFDISFLDLAQGIPCTDDDTTVPAGLGCRPNNLFVVPPGI